MGSTKLALSSGTIKFIGLGLLAVATFALGFFLGNYDSDQGSKSEIQFSPSEILQVSEDQLLENVSKTGKVIYWAGSQEGSKYSLDMSNNGASYVTYLPTGSAEVSNSKNLVIATYYREDAFQATFDAGTLENGVSILQDDESSVVYYNSALPTNVYLAFKDKPYQIEIYDPEPGKALAIASEIGRIRPIK